MSAERIQYRQQMAEVLGEQKPSSIQRVELLDPRTSLKRIMDDMDTISPSGHIEISSMFSVASIDDEAPEVLDTLAPALIKSAQRGVSTHLAYSANHVDNFHDGEVAMIPNWARKLLRRYDHAYMERRKQATQDVFTRLDYYGVNRIEHSAFGLPSQIVAWSGMDHAKYAILYDPGRVAITYLLEFNFANETMVAANSGLRIEEDPENPVLCNALREYANLRATGEKFDDYSRYIDNDTWLTVDAGHIGKSKIEEDTLAAFGSAEGVIKNAWQYPPLGEVAKMLRNKADNGEARIQWLLSLDCLKDPTHPLFEAMIANIPNLDVRYLLPSEENPKGKVHSKVILTEDQALYTSSNQHPTQKVGTGEIGLFTRRQDIVKPLHEWFDGQFENAIPLHELAYHRRFSRK